MVSLDTVSKKGSSSTQLLKMLKIFLWCVGLLSLGSVILGGYFNERYKVTMPYQPTRERTMELDLGRSRKVFVSDDEYRIYEIIDKMAHMLMLTGLGSAFGLAYIRKRLDEKKLGIS
jgi:hypothetical protein